MSPAETSVARDLPAFAPTSGEPASPAPRRERIHALDYLRGLLALSILLYHMITFGGAESDLWRKIGIYAVMGFYVLSGLSMGYAYRRVTLAPKSLTRYGIQRFFRLAPLYAAVTLLCITITPQPLRNVVLNVTLLFGVLAPGSAIPGGGWSIGNEVTFSGLFPFAMAALRRSRALFALLAAATVFAGYWFAQHLLNPHGTLAAQWSPYVWPLNHAFLFVAGVAISPLIGRIRIGAALGAVLIVALVAVFVALPIGADTLSIVIGWPRVAYSAVCIAVCGVVALWTLEFPRLAAAPLDWLGRCSYSIYLLHPLVYSALEKLTGRQLPLLTIGVSLVGAHVAYHYLELPMIEVGRRVALRAAAALPESAPQAA